MSKIPSRLIFVGYLEDDGPHSYKFSCSVEIEINSNHYEDAVVPVKRTAMYLPIFEGDDGNVPVVIESDIESNVRLDGELVSKTTEYQGGHSVFIELQLQDMARYLNEHLKEELKRVTILLIKEAGAFVADPESREGLIRSRLKEEEQAIRRRVPKTQRRLSNEEWTSLMVNLVKAAESISKLTRTALALKMYPKNANPLQQLRRTALQLYPTHTKPLDSLMDALIHRLNK